ncbi:aminoglycoside phosphotransferase family protein [Kitasatospora sp. NPDC086791]|uniref:aminoglycoside phosphotransferase family protein n=1 Tax=Kitasatospora sp. NPDC086791 TaxID=3155178 RepID=UPI003432105A
MASTLPLEERLRAELGVPRRVLALESSPRSRVWRAELSGAPVVVKQLVDAPEADERYAREVAGLTLAARVDPPVVPRLLGTDPARRVLVLEYLEHRRPAEDWLVDYAAALARLHAATGPGDAGVLPAWSGPTAGDVDAFLAFAAALGVPVASGVRAELDALLGRLLAAPGHALLHGDPCPGNDLHTGGGVRFIDFEQASLGSGLVELAYLRIGFPTCWCSTAPPAALLDAAEAAYRAAWRGATGTGAGAGPADLTDACAGWLLRGDALVQRAERGGVDHLARAVERDWTWGTATARQRLVHRLDVVAGAAADGGDRGELRGLGRLAADLRRSMLARWPRLRPLPLLRP